MLIFQYHFSNSMKSEEKYSTAQLAGSNYDGPIAKKGLKLRGKTSLKHPDVSVVTGF